MHGDRGGMVMKLNKNIFPQYIKTCYSLLDRDKPEYLKTLDKIGRELENQLSSIEKSEKIKIVFGPSFGTFPPCFIHDKLISYALRLRGAEIYPIYCDGIQSGECNYYGGVWKGKNFEESCKTCIKKSQELWHDNSVSAIPLSQYLKKDEVQNINIIIEELKHDQWTTYHEDNFPLGLWAKDILVNNYVVGDYHLIPDYNPLGLIHVRNLMVLKKVYEKILDDIKPDRVITNDSYYGMWATLQELCKKRGIPFYSTWMGGRPGTWCYAYNDAAMNLNFSKPWRSFSNIPFSESQKIKVESWLNSRSSGKEMILDTASVGKHNTDSFNIAKIDPSKPTALLAANVIWDLAALNKQIIFDDMIDWIAQTINWFSEHPEFQLIVKPHPAEMNPSIPTTKERVEVALSTRGIDIPSNVYLLSPKVAHTVYDFFPFVKVGIVHTTTVGIEMVASGLSVITTGKSPYRGFGFTLDPSTKEEYFNLLSQVLNQEFILTKDLELDLAYKFIMFYHYHYYTKVDFMDFKWRETPHMKITTVGELLPNNNECLDYIINSIILGLPILSEDRWPPES